MQSSNKAKQILSLVPMSNEILFSSKYKNMKLTFCNIYVFLNQTGTWKRKSSIFSFYREIKFPSINQTVASFCRLIDLAIGMMMVLSQLERRKWLKLSILILFT